MIDLHAKQLRDEFWANDALNGSPIGKPYKEIEFLSESSYEEGLEIRQKKLKEILSYARKFCPFYRGVKDTFELSDFPVMNKLKYIENYDLIKVDEKFIPGQVGPV
ncbi:MAG: hypothetical protein IJ263_11710, partial [Paludibacteraceae bacterium]|nr:hypothetical protein [Paludibacteraceae bacterium]